MYKDGSAVDPNIEPIKLSFTGTGFTTSYTDSTFALAKGAYAISVKITLQNG